MATAPDGLRIFSRRRERSIHLFAAFSKSFPESVGNGLSGAILSDGSGEITTKGASHGLQRDTRRVATAGHGGTMVQGAAARDGRRRGLRCRRGGIFFRESGDPVTDIAAEFFGAISRTALEIGLRIEREQVERGPARD